MESLKSPKFIFAVLGLVAVLVLTVTGKVNGETAVTVILSFGVGLGLAANTTAGKSKALLPLLFLLSVSGCATSSPKLSPRDTLLTACRLAPAALSAWRATCEVLDGEKKKKCLAVLAAVELGAGVIIGAGEATLGSCPIN
jgi:hypothetical protein